MGEGTGWAYRLGTVMGLFLLGVLSHPVHAVGELTSDQATELEEIRKRMEAKPYVPANAPGCQRWKGRAFIGPPGESSPCLNRCQLVEVDFGRYEFSGQSCNGSRLLPSSAQVSTPVIAPARAHGAPAEPQGHVLPRYTAPTPLRGQARNHGYGQQIFEGPPPGLRAGARK